MAKHGYTQQQAIEKILSSGWLTCYPIKNVPMTQQYFWDGIDKTVGYAWGSAVEEIIRREQPQQLSLFAPNKACTRQGQVTPQFDNFE